MGGATDVSAAEPQLPSEEPRDQPPVSVTRPGEWLHANLFSTWYNSVLTVVFAGLTVAALVGAGRFVLITADWDVIRVNLTNFMIGRLPREHIPRVVAAVGVLAFVLGLTLGALPRATSWRERMVSLRKAGPLVVLVVVLLAFTETITPTFVVLGVVVCVIAGTQVGRHLPPVLGRRLWLLYLAGIVAAYLSLSAGGGPGYPQFGGLMLTLFLALGGIVLSFPIGLLLGLGRRSSFPVVRLACVGYIELIRGVPLITLLFMSGLALGFFLPAGMSRPELVTRALVALVLFTAAYVAEIIRGGLQGVPVGQTEAAQAIGLSPLQTTFRVVLPQALRNVIPALVGQFISLFKDTSLVTFLGLLELLGVAQVVVEQPDFRGQGLQAVTLTFVCFIYWCFCYSMSRASQRLERRLGVGER